MTSHVASVAFLAQAAALVALAAVLAGVALAARAWAELRARRRRQVDPLSRRRSGLHPGGVNVLSFPQRQRITRRRLW